jgi:hypothetical protein
MIYLKFFEDISRDATLNKTVLFFLSDHGIRFGAVRETSVGKLEERLPFIIIQHNICFRSRMNTIMFRIPEIRYVFGCT